MGDHKGGAGRKGSRRGGAAAKVSDQALETMRPARDSMSAKEYGRFTGLQRELKDIQSELLGIRTMRNATQIRREQRMNPVNLYDTAVPVQRRWVNDENPTRRGARAPYQGGGVAPNSQVVRLQRAQATARNERRSGNIAGYLTRAAQIRRQMRDILQPGLFG